jgi:hypothetical protein
MLANPFGAGVFYILPEDIVLPDNLSFILNNELFQVFKLIKGQSLVSSFTLAFGFVGVTFIFGTFILAAKGYLYLKYKYKLSIGLIVLILLFITYGVFFQSALTSAPFLLIYSIGLKYAFKSFNHNTNL